MSSYRATHLVLVSPNIFEIAKKMDEIERHVESNLDRVRKRAAELLAVGDSRKEDGRFKRFNPVKKDEKMMMDNNLEDINYRMAELRTCDKKEQEEIIKKMEEVGKIIDANLATTRKRMKELLAAGERKKQQVETLETPIVDRSTKKVKGMKKGKGEKKGNRVMKAIRRFGRRLRICCAIGQYEV